MLAFFLKDDDEYRGDDTGIATSSTGWKVVPRTMADVTEAMTGSSVPIKVAFMGRFR